MNEIGPSSTDLEWTENPAPAWEILGRTAFFCTSLIAMTASLPAICRKKRVYSYPATILELPVVEEMPQPFVQKTNSYASLKEDPENLRALIHKLAHFSFSWSAKSELEQLGKKLDPIHPLKFLAGICKQPDLKRMVKEQILTARLIGNRFSNSLVKRLEKEHENIIPLLPDFARDLHLPIEKLQSAAENSQWTEFLHLALNESPEKA